MQTPPSSAAQSGPSPSLIFETINAYQSTYTLRAAVEFDLFTLIGKAGDPGASAAELAAQCGAAERGVRILSDALVLLGFLTKGTRDAPHRYHLTDESAAFLDKRSPAYFGGAMRFLHSDTIRGGFERLSEAVRRGGTVVGKEEKGTVAPECDVWVDFARAMAGAMTPASQSLAPLLDPHADKPLRVLDIAAGHGLFGIAMAKRNPKVHVTALDWQNVLAVAKENAKAAGLGDDRYATIAGSAFDAPLGGPYDVVLLTNFLHHFNWADCERSLARCHAALAPGGRAVILEFMPDDDRVSPADMAGFALTMLATTPEGDAWTVNEYKAMLRNTGFSAAEMFPLPPSNERVLIADRP